MSENLTTIIITLVSVLFGAGGWKFYEFLIKNKRRKKFVSIVVFFTIFSCRIRRL